MSKFSYFKEFYVSQFEVDDENSTAFLKNSKFALDIKEIKIKNYPNSFIFEDFEIVGLYNKDTVENISFELLSKFGNNIYSFRFSRRNGIVSFLNCFIKNGEDAIKSIFGDHIPSKDNQIAFEFFKHKDEIIKLILNSPSERLISLFNKVN